MSWWLWVVIGILLVGIELLSPGGFYVIFFGLAALLVGALRGLGGIQPLWLQWFLFSVFAVGSLLAFRRRLVKRLQPAQPGSLTVDTMVGELALPIADIPAGAVGKVELRGSIWDARNQGPDVLATGRRCRVLAVNGFLLTIAPE